jgi:hypothetical protein
MPAIGRTRTPERRFAQRWPRISASRAPAYRQRLVVPHRAVESGDHRTVRVSGTRYPCLPTVHASRSLRMARECRTPIGWRLVPRRGLGGVLGQCSSGCRNSSSPSQNASTRRVGPDRLEHRRSASSCVVAATVPLEMRVTVRGGETRSR